MWDELDFKQLEHKILDHKIPAMIQPKWVFRGGIFKNFRIFPLFCLSRLPFSVVLSILCPFLRCLSGAAGNKFKLGGGPRAVRGYARFLVRLWWNWLATRTNFTLARTLLLGIRAGVKRNISLGEKKAVTAHIEVIVSEGFSRAN